MMNENIQTLLLLYIINNPSHVPWKSEIKLSLGLQGQKKLSKLNVYVPIGNDSSAPIHTVKQWAAANQAHGEQCVGTVPCSVVPQGSYSVDSNP